MLCFCEINECLISLGVNLYNIIYFALMLMHVTYRDCLKDIIVYYEHLKPLIKSQMELQYRLDNVNMLIQITE